MNPGGARANAANEAARHGMREACQFGLCLGDEWAVKNAQIAAQLFGNQALMPMAALMATCHPYALDYIKQAPVLVLAVMNGQKKMNTKRRHFALTQWKTVINRQPKLRDLMRMFQIPQPMRAIRAGTLAPRYWPVIQELATMPPSTLAQVIPEKGQQAWLRALSGWMGTIQRRRGNPGAAGDSVHFGWAAQHWRDDPAIRMGPPGVACDMADFAYGQITRFDQNWTWQQAVAARDRWHGDLAKLKYGDDIIETGPFPSALSILGYCFHALAKAADLAEEGAAMHHCLASYVPGFLKGDCRIVSCRRDGQRIATAEFRIDVTKTFDHKTRKVMEKKVWRLMQFKGLCNREPPIDARAALTAYRAMVRDTAKAKACPAIA